MVSELVAGLHELARLYRGFQVQLEEWISEADRAAGASESSGHPAADVSASSPGTPGADAWLARLSALEGVFMTRARQLGAAVEAARVDASHAAGKDLSIRDVARQAGHEAVATDAAKAVAAVAALRVRALRRLETFRGAVQVERGKLAATQRLGNMYRRKKKTRGRRIDGTA